jgi:hypothetical protein
VSKFKAGDRVAADWFNPETELYETVRGCFFGINDNNEPMVEGDRGVRYFVAPNSIRRLVKRERRRVWISATEFALTMAHGGHAESSLFGPKWDDSIEFIEVRNRK